MWLMMAEIRNIKFMRWIVYLFKRVVFWLFLYAATCSLKSFIPLQGLEEYCPRECFIQTEAGEKFRFLSEPFPSLRSFFFHPLEEGDASFVKFILISANLLESEIWLLGWNIELDQQGFSMKLKVSECLSYHKMHLEWAGLKHSGFTFKLCLSGYLIPWIGIMWSSQKT